MVLFVFILHKKLIYRVAQKLILLQFQYPVFLKCFKFSGNLDILDLDGCRQMLNCRFR